MGPGLVWICRRRRDGDGDGGFSFVGVEVEGKMGEIGLVGSVFAVGGDRSQVIGRVVFF